PAGTPDRGAASPGGPVGLAHGGSGEARAPAPAPRAPVGRVGVPAPHPPLSDLPSAAAAGDGLRAPGRRGSGTARRGGPAHLPFRLPRRGVGDRRAQGPAAIAHMPAAQQAGRYVTGVTA